MTRPLRPYMLNKQIALEARKIAHAFTGTCRFASDDGTDIDEEHTLKCNTLKHRIEELALNVKLAAVQRPEPKEST